MHLTEAGLSYRVMCFCQATACLSKHAAIDAKEAKISFPCMRRSLLFVTEERVVIILDVPWTIQSSQRGKKSYSFC